MLFYFVGEICCCFLYGIGQINFGKIVFNYVVFFGFGCVWIDFVDVECDIFICCQLGYQVGCLEYNCVIWFGLGYMSVVEDDCFFCDWIEFGDYGQYG